MNYVDYNANLIAIEDFYPKVALVAHNCYQSEGKTPDEVFVRNLIKNKHLAMTEHYVFHFIIKEDLAKKLINFNNPYIIISKYEEDTYFVSMSIRPILENYEENEEIFGSFIGSLPEDIKVLFNGDYANEDEVKCLKLSSLPIDKFNKIRARHHFNTVQIITDRGVSHELVRHRPCSFAQESTRYCNYSKNKFGHSVAFMLPLDYEDNKEIYDKYYALAEEGYFKMIDNGITPDVARSLLPNGLKTSIIITTNEDEWRHIFELRLAPAAHKDMRNTMELVKMILGDDVL